MATENVEGFHFWNLGSTKTMEDIATLIVKVSVFEFKALRMEECRD
jgi:hypothetical protein